jgi:hypothetical protein
MAYKDYERLALPKVLKFSVGKKLRGDDEVVEEA